MKNPYLPQRLIMLSLMLLILQDSVSVEAATAISVPNAVKLTVDAAKNDYRSIAGRQWRYQRKKALAEQLQKAKEQLAAAQVEYEQIKAARRQLISSFEQSGVKKEDYDNYKEIKQINEQENIHLQQMDELKANYDKVLLEQEKFVASNSNLPVYASFYTGVKYYGWKSKEGETGRQFLVPFGTWMGNRKFSIGVYGNHTFSKNNTSNYSGSSNTLADTHLGLTRTLELSEKEDLQFTLTMNLPTGKSALNTRQRNSRMSDDLVEIEKFGSSFKFRPGVQYSWWPFKYDKWTIGTNLLFARYHDTTSDISNDNTKSGREWLKFIKYQHAEEKWQLVAELQNTSYNRSFSKAGWYYDTNDEWIFRLTYNRQIAKDQELAFYYWPEYQTTGGEHKLSEDSWAHLYGTRWTKFIDKKNTLRVSFDVLQTNGRRYNGLRSFYDNRNRPRSFYNEVNGRDKYTLGIGYDHHFGNKATLSLDVRYFWMHDGMSTFGEPATRYKGFNIFLMFSRKATFHW